MKVLIVEDETIPANYLKRVLIREEYDVVDIIKKGADAIRMAKEQKPDVIFMDIMLQDNISGADAAVEIHNSNPKIAIIFLTAYSDKEIIEFAVRSEAFAYLLKPYRDNEILATLELIKSKIGSKTTKSRDLDTLELADNYIYNKKLQRLFLNNKEVKLGSRALKLIKLLCENQVTLEIDDIIDRLWEEPKPKQTLRSLIHRIRQSTSSNLILNVNKFGYKIGLKF